MACAAEGPPPTGEPVTSTGGPMDTDTDGDQGPARLENACGAAPDVGVGSWGGSLRRTVSSLGGACGQGGPDAFLRLTPPTRVDLRVQARGVGFVPRVGVMLGACEERWEDRGVLCTRGLEGWVYDVASATPVLVSVGIDPDDPALDAPVSETPPDPLDFVLDVAMRRVLDAGDACGTPGAGRCAAGTACLAGADTEASVCQTLDADTCANPQDAELDLGGGALTVDPGVLQTDAHTHGCGQPRRRERVFRLGLPASPPPGASLQIRAAHPEVGLAVRAPGCDPGAELACSGAVPQGATVQLTAVGELAAVETAPYLFVELPDSVGIGDAPFALEYVFVGP